ncbi:hypothetical protein ACFSTC_48770 [Nonomuraea ferruginea]
MTPAPQPPPRQLDPQVREALTAMMRAGAQGTPAQAGSGRVHGVTSAATGKENDAWFVGWQGDLAIAVFTRNYNPAAVAQQLLRGPRRHSVIFFVTRSNHRTGRLRLNE